MSFISQDHFRTASRVVASYFRGKAQSMRIDGEQWKYLAQGNPDGEAIVFLHGLGSNKSLWRTQLIGYDDKKYYRVALDIPGACYTQYFGKKKHSLQELCRWLDQYLHGLGISKAHIVAHSSMTLVATFFAATRCEKVTSLTLLSIPDIWHADASKPGGAIYQFKQDINFSSVEDSITMFEAMFYNPPKLPKSMHRYTYNQHLQYLDRFMSVIDEFAQSLPLIMAQTKKVHCPLLIINGETDPYAPPTFVSNLHCHFKQAQVMLLRKTSHVIMLEKPKEIVELHNEFIRNGCVHHGSESATMMNSG